jgi:hypothetical protein
MKHLYIILGVLLVVIAVGAWWMTRTSQTTHAPASEAELGGTPQVAAPPPVDGGTDALGDIQAGIENVDLGNVDEDMKSIDSDIQGL